MRALNRWLIELQARDKYSFHMPGHKNRIKGLPPRYDTTELPGLDNLHSPKGAIARAQAIVANIYQVEKTYFLVNGSSVGLMAAIMTVAGTGDKVLVDRWCHKSVISGLIHSGAMPVFVEQSFCPHRQTWLPPRPDVVKEVLAANSVKAAIFTSPDYFGLSADMAKLLALCRYHGLYVIVDEAHGAHLFWGRDLGLPASAVELGADIIVQSPHKTLPACTQAAWMHVNNPNLGAAVQHNLNLLQTTSPSYLLLASLEFAGQFVRRAPGLLRKLSQLEKVVVAACRRHKISVWNRAGRDWTKLVIGMRQGMADLLQASGIYHELTQGKNALFILTMADAVDPTGIHKLLNLLPAIAQLPPVEYCAVRPPALPPQVCTPREAWQAKGKFVLITQARGRISRQLVAPYPPGTTVVAPGQRLDQDTVDYLVQLEREQVIPGWIEVI